MLQLAMLRIFLFLHFMFPTYANQEFVIGLENVENCPFICYKDDGTLHGDFEEKMTAFAKQSNHKLKFLPLPIKRLFLYFINSKVDFKFPDNPDWQKEVKENVKIFYSDPIYSTSEILLSKSKNIDFTKSNYNIGILRGYTFINEADFLKNKKITLLEVNTEKSLLEALEKNRVELILISKKSTLKLDELNIVSTHEVNYHLSTIKYQSILEDFNKFLKLHP